MTIVGDVLCPGDAGGGAFVIAEDGRRILVGVGSQSDASVQSLISVTSASAFAEWAQAWASQVGVAICGMPGVDGCKNSSSSPSQAELLEEWGNPTQAMLLHRPLRSEHEEASATRQEEVRIRLTSGQDLAGALARICGSDQRDEYFDNLAKGAGLDRNTVFGTDSDVAGKNREITVPECVDVSPKLKIAIRSEQTASSLVAQACGAQQPPEYFANFDRYAQVTKSGFDSKTTFIATNDGSGHPRNVVVPGCSIGSSRMLVKVRRGSLTDLVQQICGTKQDDEFYDELDAYNKAADTGIDRNTDFAAQSKNSSEERDVVLPICAVGSSKVAIRQTGDPSKSVRSLYDEVNAPANLTDGSGAWQGYDRASGSPGGGLDSGYFAEVFQALNPRIKLDKLPSNTAVFVPLRPLSHFNGGLVPSTGPVLQSAVSPGFGVVQSSGCSVGLNPPYDLSALLDVLRANRWHAPNYQRFTVTVLLADTGLYGLGPTGVFTAETLRLDQKLDDVAAAVRPVIGGENQYHGTQVATVILGGPLFARIQNAEASRIKLVIQRIWDKPDPAPNTIAAIDDWDGQVVALAARKQAQIVNLSLSTTLDTPRIAAEIDTRNASTLYVVAAGNNSKPISMLKIFPALYGGTEHTDRNLVTVAAISNLERWNEFSNFGAQYVDIAAPGCNISTFTYDYRSRLWSEVPATGTSFAAPWVTFTAAMIKSESGNISASETKRRLLASADLNWNFDDQVTDGRVLNVVKALSLYQDVVELKSKKLLFGRLKFVLAGKPLGEPGTSKSLTLRCGPGDRIEKFGDTPIDIGDIYKIRPGYEQDKPYARVYHLQGPSGPAQRFVSENCILPADLTLRLIGEAGEPYEPPMTEVVDIVPKLRL
jgi:subtilisin family serine protease